MGGVGGSKGLCHGARHGAPRRATAWNGGGGSKTPCHAAPPVFDAPPHMGGGGQTLEPQLAVEATTSIREETRMPPEAAGKKHPMLYSNSGIPLVNERMLAIRFHRNCASLCHHLLCLLCG